MVTQINALEGRLRALEDDFFREVDLKLRRELREKMQREARRTRLAELVKIEDEQMLDELLNLGIDERTITPLLLVPLVMVAWADDQITVAERAKVQQIVSQYSDGDAETERIIDRWLNVRPSERLWDAWKSYVDALRERSSGTVAAMLTDKLIDHAQSVANVSKRFLMPTHEGKLRALQRLRHALDVD